MTSYSTLYNTLLTNVVELKFNRRRPKSNVQSTRRMICTLDNSLLTSERGISVLGYKTSSGVAAYNTQAKGLVVVWDILMQDWRMVNTESCNIISVIPTSPAEEFWDYFNVSILPLSSSQKLAFINT